MIQNSRDTSTRRCKLKKRQHRFLVAWRLPLKDCGATLAAGTKVREKKKKVVAETYKRVVYQRTDFFNKIANELVGEYCYIFAEDLKPSEMLSYRAINRTLYDTAWVSFLFILSCKAAEAGREFRKVNPAHTSQDCSACEYRQKMPLSVRVYKCPSCGLELSRDVNAARNIKRLGLESLASKNA